MELVTLTTEIKEFLELRSSHIFLNNQDFIVMPKQINNECIILAIPNINVNYGTKFDLFFRSKAGDVILNLIVDIFYPDDSDNMIIVECSILNSNNSNFFNLLDELISRLIAQKKRKEERILCCKKNLEILNLHNIIYFDYNYRKVKGIIKDISYTGLRVLCDPIVLNENGNLFSFKLKFTNPDESFLFVNSPIRRKELFEYQNTKFASIVFKLNSSIKFKERIDHFLNNNNSYNSKSIIKSL